MSLSQLAALPHIIVICNHNNNVSALLINILVHRYLQNCLETLITPAMHKQWLLEINSPTATENEAIKKDKA